MAWKHFCSDQRTRASPANRSVTRSSALPLALVSSGYRRAAMVNAPATCPVHLLEPLSIFTNDQADIENRRALRILPRTVPRSIHAE